MNPFARLAAILFPDSRTVPPIIQPDANELLRKADALRDGGRAAEAAVAYREALACTPGRFDIQVQLANMLKDSGQLLAAEAAYRLALTQADQADTHLQLGHVLKAMGRRAMALAEYRQALHLDPECRGAIRELAEAGERDQQRNRAEIHLREGGIEAILTLTHTIAAMRAELDRLSRTLPDPKSCTAFPPALYDTFRDLFPIPAPPAPPSEVTFQILLLAQREDVPTLFAQIAAIQSQSWPHWTLAVLGHAPEHQRVAELAASADPRIAWIPTPPETPLAGVEPAQPLVADWLLLLAPGATLDPHALAWFAQASQWSEASAFICDEETGTQESTRLIRSDPQLRQLVDPDTLSEANVFGETIAIRSQAYRSAASALPQSSVTEARAALLKHLVGTARVGHVPYPLLWRSRSTPPTITPVAAAPAAKPETPIAIIVPTRDNAEDVQNLLLSLNRTADQPQAFEMLVIDNGTTRPGHLDILQNLASGSGIKLLRRDQVFNWSHLNNQAVTETAAPLLVFANDDMRMITPGWDTRIRATLARPDIGALGARLLYDDDTVQHAGVLFGWKGSVIHDGLFEPATEPGPTARWHVTRAVGAVTGAFLATTRQNFLAFGGFDGQFLPVAYSDIDFALKLRTAGLKVLWTPAITLYHHESKSRGMDHTDPWQAARNTQERAIMQARWGAAMDIEPGVHPFWQATTLPFRLLAAPSLDRIRDHITRTGALNPWTIHPVSRVHPGGRQ